MYSRFATIELPWPELSSWPDYGLVMPRATFDHLLIERAQKAGARLLERTEAVEPIVDGGWVTGARVRPADDRDAEPTEVVARFTIAADGAASRFAKPAGCAATIHGPSASRPSLLPRALRSGPWFESWLDLWEGDLLLPGYGWLFPVAGGRINLGAGLLNTFKDFKQISRSACSMRSPRCCRASGASPRRRLRARALRPTAR